MKKFTWPTERVGALSDGVYAIVLTLLVLDLKVPGSLSAAGSLLVDALQSQTGNFIAYAISFILAAQYWLRHHALFAMVERVDGALLRLNFLHLFPVTLLPFTASLIGQFDDSPLAVSLFAGNLAAIGLTTYALYVTAQKRGEIARGAAGSETLRLEGQLNLATPGVAAVSIVMAQVDVDYALYVWAATPLAVWLTKVVLRRAYAPAAPAE